MVISKGDSIAIIGGGKFSLSTALELSNKGYTDITVFEKDDEIPSRWSAANDLNKTMRAEYEGDFYTDLAVEATQVWQTLLFAPYFHCVGLLNCVSGASPQKAVDIMRAEDIRNIVGAWQITGEMPGWEGYMCKYDGYVHSGSALRGSYREAKKKGVRFFLGKNVGTVVKIVYDGEDKSRKSVGAQTKAGHFYAAKLVVVTVGAAAYKIIPEIGTEVLAKSWSVVHVLLSDYVRAVLRGTLATYARDLGFFIKPDPKTNLLKLCPMGGGYINTNPKTGVSKAPEGLLHLVPKEDERKMQELLRQTLPYLADRPLIQKFPCWFADTADSDFIVDYVPDTSFSVMILSGDVGHGSKMFPMLGRWVDNLLNLKDDKQSISRWRWRIPKLKLEGESFDDGVSWRISDVRELRDVQEEESVTSKL